MATTEHLRPHRNRRNRFCGDPVRDYPAMSVVEFEDLQLLSGYRQVSKVVDFLKAKKIPFVIGGDGKPRTTDDILYEAIKDEKEKSITEVRFSG
jgi:hypothetical protein